MAAAGSIPFYQPPASREAPFEAPSWATPPAEKPLLYLEIVQDGDVIDCMRLKSRAFWVIGRPEKAHITCLHESISRQHSALVHHRDGRWFVIDLKSAHGTSINGHKTESYVPAQVHVGDEVMFGKSDRTYTIREGDVPEFFRDEEARAAKKKRADDADSQQLPSKRPKTETPDKIRASHILVKHRESRRPSSWRENLITRSKVEAAKIVSGYREQIVSGEKSFEQIARNYSDCSSAKQDGDLGMFGKNQMQPSFETAAFALKIGELSDLVYSDSGVHIIKRTA